jgi:hypothetical protein
MSSISVRPRRVARLLASAAAASLALGLAAGAQDGEGGDADAAPDPAALCGADFAASGATSNVEYAGVELAACDALVVQARTSAELLAAADRIGAAHEGVLARWVVVNQELMDVARAPSAPALRGVETLADDEDAASGEDAAAEDAAAEEGDGESEEAAAPAVDPNNPWDVKRAERHAVETGMDGLRILIRLSNQIANRYADPSALAAALPGPAAARAPEVLAERAVCASAGRPPARNLAALPPSWYMFAGLDPVVNDDGEETAPAVDYEVEVVDDVARIAETFIDTELATAPSLGVSELTSYADKADCPRRDFPSEHPDDS